MVRLRRLLGSLLRTGRGVVFDPSRSAGYDIAVVPEGQEPDWSPPHAQVGVVESAAVPLTVGPDGTRYVAYVRARTAAGIVGPPASVAIHLVAQGGQLVARPNSPTLLAARAIAGGEVEVSWAHSDLDASQPAVSFEIYAAPAGQPLDYEAPVAVAQQHERRAVLTGLAAGVQYRVGVRAIGPDGESDGNRAVVLVVPRADQPPRLTGLIVVQTE